jgi:hypothetical protein
MIEATQRKLGEARFFYQHLVNERQQTFRHADSGSKPPLIPE